MADKRGYDKENQAGNDGASLIAVNRRLTDLLVVLFHDIYFKNPYRI